MRRVGLWATMLLSSCVRSASPSPAPREEDLSIVFPNFFGDGTVTVGEQGKAYELDGVMLKAITLAAHDFLPPAAENPPCWARPEAHRYRIIRQGDLLFVRIDADIAHCERGFMMLDYGASYAIHADGRILRRLFDSEPDGSPAPGMRDAGAPDASNGWIPASRVGVSSGPPTYAWPPRMPDGGIGPPVNVSSAPVDGGT